MGKLWVEVCLISARGLRRTSSFFKFQWFAVGWIDPNKKYCSKINASGNANPVWRAKFSNLSDKSEPTFQELAIHIEVYNRDPIFLRESLQGTATIMLKEFVDKYMKNSELSKPVEEVGSFQLRKRNSGKPQGFVDVSIRISEEREETSSCHGDEEGFKLAEYNHGIDLANDYGSGQRHPSQIRHSPQNHSQTSSPYSQPGPVPKNYSNPSFGGPRNASGGGTGFQPPIAELLPPPPPPPSNVGYVPRFCPRMDNSQPSYEHAFVWSNNRTYR